MVWAFATARLEHALIYGAILIGFAAIGALPLYLQRIGRSDLRLMALFFSIDVLLITAVLMVPGSMFPSTLTPQFNLQLPNFLYLCLYVVGMAICYSPLLVLWIGFLAIVSWSAGMVWIVALPDSLAFTLAELLNPQRFSDEERLAITSSRSFVSLTHWYNRVLFLALVTGILAAAVWRSRSLLKRQLVSESARSNLSRYFSPSMVEYLSTSEQSVGAVDQRKVAVLFADIVGFTSLTEVLGPHETIEMLRRFHRLMAECVFEHHGTVDKYIGDALMANFGTPVAGRQDATNAAYCAARMREKLAELNREREAQGRAPIRIGIGIHFGEVVSGNIGSDEHLEYAMVGDTVNVASRLEGLTRELNAVIVVSDDLVRQVRAEGTDVNHVFDTLVSAGSVAVKGRDQPLEIWKSA